jgi:hypothetical protein
VIHCTLLVAVQLQLVVMLKLPEPPLAGTLVPVEDSLTSQDAAGCEMVKTWLPTATLPVRGCAAGFAVTV